MYMGIQFWSILTNPNPYLLKRIMKKTEQIEIYSFENRGDIVPISNLCAQVWTILINPNPYMFKRIV